MRISSNDLEKVPNFQQEKDKFYLLNLISKTEGNMTFSDLETYVIGRSMVGLPTWIWTIDSITPEKILELESILENFLEEGENKFTAKKKIYEILRNEYDTSSYFEMGYLSCANPIKPQNKKGRFVRASYSDIMTLAKMWIENEKEMEKKDIELYEAIETVEEWVKGENFYILKNELGKIVCMAGYSSLDDTAKITHVFTPKEERGNGYCKSLIYALTKKILDKGLKPLLYTDYNYKASNKAYQDVGYTDEGILINFTITRQKDKDKQI